jgi:hypothetical protein
MSDREIVRPIVSLPSSLTWGVRHPLDHGSNDAVVDGVEWAVELEPGRAGVAAAAELFGKAGDVYLPLAP